MDHEQSSSRAPRASDQLPPLLTSTRGSNRTRGGRGHYQSRQTWQEFTDQQHTPQSNYQGRRQNHQATQHNMRYTQNRPLAPQVPPGLDSYPPLGSNVTAANVGPFVQSDAPSQEPSPAARSVAQSFFHQSRGGGFRHNHHSQYNHRPSQLVQSQMPSNEWPRSSPANRGAYDPRTNPLSQAAEYRISNRHRSMEQSDFLTGVALVCIKENRLPREEITEKHAFREKLERLAISTMQAQAQTPADSQGAMHILELESYGSLSNSFGTKGCDADLLLTAKSSSGAEGYQELSDLYKRNFEKALLDAGIGARLLTKTRVPILRIYERPNAEFLAVLQDHRRKWEDGELNGSEADSLGNMSLPTVPQAYTHSASVKMSIWDDDASQVPLPDTPPATHAKLEPMSDFGISCDINFSNRVALKNTRLLWRYGQCDERVRQMGIFVKSWAKARDINTPYVGSLSSYGYILMVLHYLMNVEQPPVIPNLQALAHDDVRHPIQIFEDLNVTFLDHSEAIKQVLANMPRNSKPVGALLKGFYQYYTLPQGFNWMHEVISIRTPGGILKKAAKGWTQASQNNSVRLRYLLAIEDPFEIDHNVARTVGHNGIVTIRDEFRRAWYIISNIEKVTSPTGVDWIYQRQNKTIGNGIELIEKAEHGDLLRKDQEAGRKLRQLKREAEARYQTALSEQIEPSPGHESENGTSHKQELNELAQSSSPKTIAVLTETNQQEETEEIVIKSWNDFSKRVMADDNASDEALGNGPDHHMQEHEDIHQAPSFAVKPPVIHTEGRVVASNSDDKARATNSHPNPYQRLSPMLQDNQRQTNVPTIGHSQTHPVCNIDLEAAQSQVSFTEVASVKDLAAINSTVGVTQDFDFSTIMNRPETTTPHTHTALYDRQQLCSMADQQPAQSLTGTVGQYIEWDADTEGGRLLLWRDRKIRSDNWTGTTAGDKGRLFARFPYNPNMTFEQLANYNRVLQKLYKVTIHARATDDEMQSQNVGTRQRDELRGTTEPLTLRTSQVLIRSGSRRSMSRTRVGKNISWTTDTDVGQWLLWRDRRIREGEWRRISGAFDGLMLRIDRLYPHNPSMTNSDLDKYNQELRHSIGDLEMPRSDMGTEDADHLKLRMHEALDRVVKQRGESTKAYDTSTVVGSTELASAPRVQSSPATYNSPSSIELPPLSSKKFGRRGPGPIAWNLGTSAGVWLTWRDKKMAGGDWRDTLPDDSVLRKLSELFPYSIAMSATELASKNAELSKYFRDMHVPTKKSDESFQPLYNAIVCVLQDRQAAGTPLKSQLLLDLLQSYESPAEYQVSQDGVHIAGTVGAGQQQKPCESDFDVIADLSSQLDQRHLNYTPYAGEQGLDLASKSESGPEYQTPAATTVPDPNSDSENIRPDEATDQLKDGSFAYTFDEPPLGSWDTRHHDSSDSRAWSSNPPRETALALLTIQNLADLNKMRPSTWILAGDDSMSTVHHRQNFDVNAKGGIPSSLLPNTWRYKRHDCYEDSCIMPIPRTEDFLLDAEH